MTTGDLAGRRLWIGVPGLIIEDDTRRLLEEIRPGGVVLFGRNIESASQVARLVTDLRSVLGENLRISVDQIGTVEVSLRNYRPISAYHP